MTLAHVIAGAATGALLGGPVGAVVGGVAGALTAMDQAKSKGLAEFVW